MKTPEQNEAVTKIEKLQSPDVIPFPIDKVRKSTGAVISSLTDKQREASKMMGELPAFTSEIEKQAHIERVKQEQQGANECVVLVLELGRSN